jgi:hypothetical protein
MKKTVFSPGFRLSVSDVCVLAFGVAIIIILSMYVWWWSFIPAFVLAHFFLFCNVLRAARPLELLWASVFILLAGSTITLEVPGWFITVLVSLLMTAIVVTVEIRKPSYHGAGWQRLNPELPVWWETHISEKKAS